MEAFRGRVVFSQSVSKVFHIEDDCLWAEVTAHLLEEWPEVCHVGTATNGRDGIALCREKHPAIVLLALVLPDINGFVVLDRLNDLPHPPLVLLLTCRTDEVLLNRLGSGGIAGLIWKGGIRKPASQQGPPLTGGAGGRTGAVFRWGA